MTKKTEHKRDKVFDTKQGLDKVFDTLTSKRRQKVGMFQSNQTSLYGAQNSDSHVVII